MSTGAPGPDPREVYADIIGLPHHQSRVRPRMSRYDRAAQFAPFAALTGFEDMIGEEARITEARIEPGEDALERLNRQLSRVQEENERGRRPLCAITYFVPDPLKAGGRYVTEKERVRRIDPAAGRLILTRPEGKSGACAEIELDRVLELIPEEEP